MTSMAALQRQVGNRAVCSILRATAPGSGSAPGAPAAQGAIAAPGQSSSTSQLQRVVTGQESPSQADASPVATPQASTATATATAATSEPASLYGARTPQRALIEEAGSAWKQVKAKHLGKGGSPETMKQIVDYRKLYVDGLLEQMKAKYGVGARAVGSTALSSDYDVTFLGPMSSAAAAVVDFNGKFRDDWHAESGIVFDTNVYAEDFLGAKPANGVRDDDPTMTTQSGTVEDAALQDANALVKVRKNMSKTAWTIFVSRVVLSLPDSQQATARKQFDQADATFRTTYVASMLRRLPPDKVATMRRQGKSDAEIVEDLETGAEGVEAANREYETQLIEVGRLEKLRDNLASDVNGPPTQHRWTELTLQIRQAKSKAMLFANEPYFSAGTLYHVVGNMQGAWGIKLGIPEYFQSANENFGDFKKEIAHHGHGGEVHDPFADFVAFAVASSKYAFRFLDAADKMRSAGVPIEAPVSELRAMEGRLLAIRQGEALGEDGNRIDERAIGAKRDATGKLRKKDARGEATGDLVATTTDYSSATKEKKDADAGKVVGEMGVSSIEGLDRKFTSISVEINVKARQAGLDRTTS